jgi:sugar phosphate isomerase/epimerase
MIQELLDLGFSHVELSVRVTAEMIAEISDMVNQRSVIITGLHNYCPVPPGVDPSGDLWTILQLSSADRSERAAAVRATKNTIDWAARLHAPVVVMHLGIVPINVDGERVFRLVRAGRPDDAKEILRGHLMERLDARGPYLNNLIESLGELAPYAEKAGVKLGCENRYFYTEIPSIDEFMMIFKRVKSPALCYWHDTGHAHVSELLTISAQEDYLRKYADRLIGMHIHDAAGFDDHQAIGKGEIDFGRVLIHARPDTQLVLEIHGRASAEELVASREAISRLRQR